MTAIPESEISEPMIDEEVYSRKRTLEVNDESEPSEKRRAMTNNIVFSIQDIFRCPVCLETASVPFEMCVSGHINCCKCTDNLKLKRCALCRKHFVSQSPEILVNILSCIPVKCPYHIFGCPIVYENNEDRKHELFCPYRLVTCRDCSCAVPINAMRSHYDERHLECYVLKDPVGGISWSMTDPSVTFHECPAMVFDQIFWVTIVDNVRLKEMKIFVQFLPIEEPEDDYYVSIELSEKGYTYSRCVKACILSHWEANQIIYPQGENIPDDCCMLVDHKLRALLTNDSGLLTTDLYFSKIPKS